MVVMNSRLGPASGKNVSTQRIGQEDKGRENLSQYCTHNAGTDIQDKNSKLEHNPQYDSMKTRRRVSLEDD
jgi:hypothetical protein